MVLHGSRLSAEELLEHMRIPGHPRVYLVGCLDKRVTLYSQQVRALNLVYALFKTGQLSANSKLAIVGGGVAGLTAAASAAKKCASVTVLEQDAALLHIQRGCDKRWLHPHIYDWPAANSLRKDTNELSVLTWEAGPADQVTKTILKQWDELCGRVGSERITVHLKVENVAVDPSLPGSVGVSWTTGFNKEQFDAVILAIGFGIERHIPPLDEHSYWRDDRLAQSDFGASKRILISGIGDGGLTDLLRACIRDFRHETLIEDFHLDLTKPEQGNHFSLFHGNRLSFQLLNIEKKARALASDGDYERRDVAEFIWNEYQSLDNLCIHIDSALQERLRSDREVFLNGSSPYPLSLRASILNRFLALRLIKLKAVTYWQGVIDQSSVQRQGDKWRVTLDNRRHKDFDHIVIRHGTEPALEEGFPELASACRSKQQYLHNFDQTRVPIFSEEQEAEEEHERQLEYEEQQRASFRLASAVILGKDATASQMVRWFFHHYTDPANGVPWNGREGGYMYLLGGPHQAEEVLDEYFSDADEEEREEAINTINEQGWDWVEVGLY